MKNASFLIFALCALVSLDTSLGRGLNQKAHANPIPRTGATAGSASTAPIPELVLHKHLTSKPQLAANQQVLEVQLDRTVVEPTPRKEVVLNNHLTTEPEDAVSEAIAKQDSPYPLITQIELTDNSTLLPAPVAARSKKVNSSELETIQPNDSSFEIAQGASEIVGDTFADDLRQQLFVEPLITEKIVFPVAPGSTLGVPTGFGANWGNAFLGQGFSSSRRTSNKADGAIAFGIGFGDSRKAVGLELNIGILSLDSADFGDSGNVGFKLSRIIDSKGNFSIAIGWENVAKWGDADEFNNNKDTVYGVVTGRFLLQPEQKNKLPLTFSLGVGSGRFRSKGAFDANEQTVGVFASIGLRVIPQISLINTWTGQELNMGASFTPFRNFPLVFNAGEADVTSVFDQGTRFIFTTGYAINF